MTFLDAFKKKNKKTSAQKGKGKQPEKSEAISILEQTKEQEKQKFSLKQTQKRQKAISGNAWRILQYPHVTEKASSLVEKNQYTFRVTPEANKVEVKKAIEEIYGVDVVDVRMTSIPAKKRQRGRIEGWTKEYKKAIVRVKEGQKIEVLPR
jgi:large subunit ribosomal protein L23